MIAIDVVIPVWNRARIVGRAIDSVLSQEVPPDWAVKIIVVDDASTDDLAAALQPYGSRVVCIRQARNGGAASARNRGIEAADGDYIAFLDSDDIWLPGKLAAQVAFMRDQQLAASCTAYVLTRPDRPDIISPRYPTGRLGIADFVWGCFVSPGSTLMCERRVFHDIGVYDVAFPRLEDWDLLMRFVRTRDLGFLAEPLARIEASRHADAKSVLAALDHMGARHGETLSPSDRRQFIAAIEFERAAAYHRDGLYIRAMTALVRSLWLSPRRHVALRAVLHNRLARV
jgi:glycosyltransferase involved in cell wall biosynthesis